VCCYRLKFLNGQKLTIIFQKLTIIISLFLVISLNAKEKITLGLTGVTLKEDISTIMSFKNYLSLHADIDLNVKFAKSYSIMESFIINETVDFAYVCGSTFIDLANINKVELLAIPVFNQKSTYSSLIISKKETTYQSLNDLKNKTFAMSDPDSNSGALIPFYEILKKGYHKDTFFEKVIYTYDHGESIEAVLSGFVEAASVDSMIYQSYIKKHPSSKEKIKIIQEFSGFPIPPFILRKNLHNSTKLKLQQTLLDMNKDEKGKEILEAMSIDSFKKPDTISYDKIREIKKFILNFRDKNVQ